jgi:hypothetical protein
MCEIFSGAIIRAHVFILISDFNRHFFPSGQVEIKFGYGLCSAPVSNAILLTVF